MDLAHFGLCRRPFRPAPAPELFVPAGAATLALGGGYVSVRRTSWRRTCAVHLDRATAQGALGTPDFSLISSLFIQREMRAHLLARDAMRLLGLRVSDNPLPERRTTRR